MLFCIRILKIRKCVVKFHSLHSWRKPNGFDTGIKIYNCITRNKEPLIIKNKNLVTWYTCGPTVYDSSHVGHASCYVKLDTIQKILRNYFKYNLVTVMNITDVDDKIIARANQMKKMYKDVANMYEKEFFEDLKDLGIQKPNIILRVTDNMDIIIDFIKQLESKGQAYKAADNSVYFSVDKINYGKLVNIGGETKQKTKKGLKRNEMDFALWKESREGEPYWHGPWGKGRPGWHIECSALATHALGKIIK